MPHAREFASTLCVAVTHSEYSSRAQRQAWSKELGVPVLDEYSSEEATRIALELPCGHYRHPCRGHGASRRARSRMTMQPQVLEPIQLCSP